MKMFLLLHDYLYTNPAMVTSYWILLSSIFGYGKITKINSISLGGGGTCL